MEMNSVSSIHRCYLSIPLEQGLSEARSSRTGALAPTYAARSDELKVETLD